MGPLIVTVTLNLALDVTYRVAQARWRGVNRVEGLARRAGGKGVNVARVLAALDELVVAAGLVGGTTGDAIRDDLTSCGLAHALTPIAGESRRTLTVLEEAHGEATGFWEPGPTVGAVEWERFVDRYDRLLAFATAVVLSGSLPPGLPVDAYATLCAHAAQAGVPVVLDADGEPLRHGLAGRPAIVKPNAEELAGVSGHEDPEAGAAWLRARGAVAAVVSLGAGGLLADTPNGRWRARPPATVRGNPTGAGDAVVAALVRGHVAGQSWPERLVQATALAAAAVRAPIAGGFDADTYRSLVGQVTAEPG